MPLLLVSSLMEVPKSKYHAVLFPCPGIGHLIPFLELGKRLVLLHNFDVTFFVIASQSSAAESEIIKSAMSLGTCDVVELPAPDISALVDADATVGLLLALKMREIKATFRSAISAFKSSPTVLIVDPFGTDFFAIADELGILKYVYIASHAWFLALSLYAPTLDKLVEGEYVDQKEPLQIPGCRPVRPEDVFEPMWYRTHRQYLDYIRNAEEITKGDAILVNTWEELEATTLAALGGDALLGRIAKVPVYAVGPMIRSVGPSAAKKNELLDWLDKQPSESVLYVSFGSGGTLSLEQMTEVAWGLEQSGQRFIWVVRPPNSKSSDGSFFNVGKGGDDVSSYLPEGFSIRTRGFGILVEQWASQVDILSHPSVGGFLTHCGWNSALESMATGVPMIAWPLYAEQMMNATMLAEEIGVAVRSKILPSTGIIGREEIKTMVRKIMVEEGGHAVRAKAKELKHSAEKAWSKGGSSYMALSRLADHCETTMKLRKQHHLMN